MFDADFFAGVLEVVDDCVLEAPWFIVEELPEEVDCWFAVAPLVTDWLPLPMFTPGLMFAAAFTSVLLMPTFASTATFGSTFTLRPLASRDALVPVEALPLRDDCTPWTPCVAEALLPVLVVRWPAETPLETD